jgi:hypothetical protein
MKYLMMMMMINKNNSNNNRVAPELRRLGAGFPARRPKFYHRSGHVKFVVDKVAPERLFSEYFGFPCQFSFHQLL